MVKLGASFTGVTCTGTGTAVAEASDPSHALTVNAFRVPFALVAGVQIRLSPEPSNVVPGTTGNPPLVSVPLLTASIRNWRLPPLTSLVLTVARIGSVNVAPAAVTWVLERLFQVSAAMTCAAGFQ